MGFFVGFFCGVFSASQSRFTCHARAHDPNTGKKAGLFGLAKSNNVSLNRKMKSYNNTISYNTIFARVWSASRLRLRIRPRERLSYCKL